MKRTMLLLVTLSLGVISCKKDRPDENELPNLNTCTPAAPAGRLSYSPKDGTYTYVTTGGGSIVISPPLFVLISHKDYHGFTIEFWGYTDGKLAGTHENLNGKHIKDRLTSVRSLVFPDGAKITMNATGVYDPLTSISIYDNGAFHHINLTCNVIAYSSSQAGQLAQMFDQAEPDGETARFEFTQDGLIFYNSYSEHPDGKREENRQDLGRLSRENPNEINDLYDDERLGHT